MSPYRIPRSDLAGEPAWDVVDRMWKSIRIDETDLYVETIGLASPGQRATYAYWCYKGQVDNGGHEQFFFNSTGIVWKDYLNGCELLQAEEHREVIYHAALLFPDSNPSLNQETRRWQLENLIDSASFRRLDEWLASISENFPALVEQRIRSYPEEFFLD